MNVLYKDTVFPSTLARTTYMLTSSYPGSFQVLRKFKKYVAEYAVENSLVCMFFAYLNLQTGKNPK